jgi:hypothetical protein
MEFWKNGMQIMATRYKSNFGVGVEWMKIRGKMHIATMKIKANFENEMQRKYSSFEPPKMFCFFC